MVLGHHSHRRHSQGSSRGSLEESRDGGVTTPEDETVVDADQGNVLSHIISQLRPGADLSRVTLPTFILEPRSMLERITNFMAHPETLLPMPDIEDPLERFVSVVKFYLSGWHIKPPGVKKPLNPILGETYTCYWDYRDKTRGYYIAEQTSHHPPKSSYFFMAPEHHIRIDGTLKPRSKFLGNSAASMMEGIAVMRFLNRGERFFITQPNMYARGILFGKMKYELGDHSFVRCPELGLIADLEFKTKGWMSGTYNAIGGYIKDMKTDKALFELSGYWNGEMHIKDLTSGKKTLLFDATNAKETAPLVRPAEEQGERESQKLWKRVNIAIKNKDHNAATDEKSKIEEQQRHEAAERAEQGVEWRPTLFRSTHGGQGGLGEGEEDLDFIINAKVDAKSASEQIEQILAIAAVLPGQKHDRRFEIPERKENSKKSEESDQIDIDANKVQSQMDLLNLGPSNEPPQLPAKQQELEDQKGAGHFEDLIDFGQHEAPARSQAMNPNAVPKSATPTAPAASIHGPSHATIAGDATPRAAPVSDPSRVMRQDSQTSEIEEFVDAQS